MYDGAYETTATTSSGDALFSLFGILVLLAVYLYFSYCQYRMSSKCGYGEYGWWAFIPIMNTILLIKMAEKPMWWILLILVPVVNLFVFFALWMAVAKNCGQSPFWGFLMPIPFLNFIAAFVLAFNSPPSHYPPQSAPTAPPSQPREPQKVG